MITLCILFYFFCPDSSGSPVCDQCLPHYSGPQCDECSAGFFRSSVGCVHCDCSGNTDPQGPTQLCHPKTGHCFHCINNTTGPQCQFCAPGFVGNATAHNCTRPSKLCFKFKWFVLFFDNVCLRPLWGGETIKRWLRFCWGISVNCSVLVCFDTRSGLSHFIWFVILLLHQLGHWYKCDVIYNWILYGFLNLSVIVRILWAVLILIGLNLKPLTASACTAYTTTKPPER